MFPRRALLLSVAAFGAVYIVAVLTWPGQALDEGSLGRMQVLGVGPLREVWPWLARRALPFVLVIVVAVLGLLVSRHHASRVVVVVVVVGVTATLSVVLQHLLPRPTFGAGYGYAHNTFPSTHASATLALVVAVWLLAPRRPEWLLHVLVVAAGIVLVGNVVGHAHRPSDVLGSTFLVGSVAGGVSAAFRVTARRRSARRRRAVRDSAPR